MRIHTGEKTFLMPGVWKMIFRCQQLDRAHAKAYWRKHFVARSVEKDFPVSAL